MAMAVWVYGVPTIFVDSSLVKEILMGGVGISSEALSKVYRTYIWAMNVSFAWMFPEIRIRYIAWYPHYFVVIVVMIVWLIIKTFLWDPITTLLSNLLPQKYQCDQVMGEEEQGCLAFSEAILPEAANPMKGHQGYAMSDNAEYAEAFA